MAQNFPTKHPTCKRFLISFWSLLAVGLAVTWIWADVGKMWYMDGEYVSWLYKKEILRDSCLGQKTVILGDSQSAFGIDTREIGPNVVNLALTGSSFVEQYYAVQMMIARCNQRPRRVIVSVAPVHIMLPTWYLPRTMPFHFLSFKQSQEVAYTSVLVMSDELYSDDWNAWVKNTAYNLSIDLSFPTHYFTKIVQNTSLENKRANDNFYQIFLRDKGIFLNYTAIPPAPNDDIVGKTFVPSRIVDVYLRKFLDECQVSGVEVNFLDLPISAVTSIVLDKQFISSYSRYVDDNISHYPNVHRLGAVLPVYDNEMFADRYHLNLTGAKKFSRQLKLDLDQLGGT